jgi:hypothetical protein
MEWITAILYHLNIDFDLTYAQPMDMNIMDTYVAIMCTLNSLKQNKTL